MAEVSGFLEEISADDFDLTTEHHWYRHFWASRKQVYPTLWKVVRLVLGTPPSSIPVESLFSVLGSIDSRRRRAMTTERLCAVTLANSMRFFREHGRDSRVIAVPVARKVVPLIAMHRHPSEEELNGVEAVAAEAVALAADDESHFIVEADADAPEDPRPPKRARTAAGGAGGNA